MRRYFDAPLCVHAVMSVWVRKTGREREGAVSKVASGKKEREGAVSKAASLKISQLFQSCYPLEANVS